MSTIQECPCHLTQEQLERLTLLDGDLFCKSKYADKSINDDGSFMICGLHLGAHPTEADRSYRRQMEFAQLQQNQFSSAPPGDDLTDIVSALKVVIQEVQQVKVGQQLLNLSIPKQYDQHLTPSANCKTDQGHSSIFSDILQLCRFGVGNLLDRAIDASSETLQNYNSAGNPDLEFQKKTTPKWSWNEKEEKDSYEPLREFLTNHNIHVVDVSAGAGLPYGNLFDVQLFSLKKNLNLRSNELSSAERAIYRYHLRGRTDFIRLKHPHLGISRFNIQYYLEIKPANIGEAELREAFFQLLGGNVGNTDRSPPVLITNLTSHHYILFISLYQGEGEGNDYAFQLNIFKFKKFHQSIKYLEDTTSSSHCCTRDFLRPPTPSDSPRNVQDGDNSNGDDDNDVHELENSNSEIEVVSKFVGLVLESDDVKGDSI